MLLTKMRGRRLRHIFIRLPSHEFQARFIYLAPRHVITHVTAVSHGMPNPTKVEIGRFADSSFSIFDLRGRFATGFEFPDSRFVIASRFRRLGHNLGFLNPRSVIESMHWIITGLLGHDDFGVV